MPILRLFTSAGTGATVPDATTTTAGKVRLATIAEANGSSELIAVTPAGLQAELAGIVGGMEFKGAYDIGIGVPDLTTGSTKKGDYYVVTNVKLNPTDTNVTKELYGQEWAVGDHLVVTRDIASGETDYNDAITKVDNSESISVLTDLLDVAISAEADGQVLVYDGTGEEWVNRELTVADVLNAVTQADHDALDARVTVNEGAISSIEGRVTTNEGDISSLEPRVTTNEGDISSIDGRVTTNEGDISALDGRVTTNQGNITAVKAELNTTQSWAGLNSNGTYTPDPTANYISTASTLKNADSLLDDQVKINADAISAAQTEINAIETGAGLSSSGVYIPDPTADYISGASSLKNADSLLDDKLKETRDLVDNLGASSVSSVNSISPVAGDVTVGGADIDTAHSAVNYTAAAADLDSHLSGVDTELGALQTQITSNDGDITALGGRVTTNEGDISALDGRLTTAEGELDDLEIELDATQQGAGLEANGAYVANVSTNYISAVSSLKGADEALDAKLKETRDLVDNFSTNNVASVNGILPVAGDVTVGATDIDTAHTAVNYTAAAADLDAHLAGIDTELGLAVNSVNTVTPTDGALTLGGADIDTAHTASDYTASATDLDAHLAGIDTRLSEKANSADLADIATSGAASDASVTATPTEYSAATSDVEAHLVGIDTRLADKANSADLATIATSGAASDASVTATPTNYTSATADVEAHLAGIDTKLGTLETATVNNIAAVDGNITIGGADIDTAHTAVNYTAASADLDAHLAGLDTELGLAVTSVNTLTPTDGALTLGGADIDTAHTAVNYTAASADLDAHLAGLDTEVGLKANSADLADIATSGLASDADVGQTGPLDPGKYVSAGASVLDHLTGIAQFMATVNGEALIQEIKENFVVDAITQFDSANSLIYYTSPSNETSFTIALPDMANETITEVNKLAPHIYFYNRGQADLTFTIVTTEANVNGVDLLTYFHALNDFDHTTTGLGAGVTSFVVPKQTGAALHRKITFDSGVTERVDYLFLSVESLSSLGDVDLTGVADGDALVYDATSSKFVVSPLGTTSVSSVNGVSPVSGNVTLGGADIDTAHTAVGYTAASADLDSHIAGIDASLQGKSLVSASIITGAGLEEDGSYLANGSTNYLGTATSLKDADEALDTELALKANIASPALTGTPTAPTASQGTNTTQIATTAFVATELSALSTTAAGAEGVIQVSDGSAGFSAGQWSLNATSGAFLPDGNNTRDIGSASARAKDAYLNAIKVGASQLDVSIDGTSGRLVAGGGTTALTADSAEIVLSSDLATVATSGDYADLSNAPTSFINSASFITDADALTLESGKHYIIGTATGSTKTMTLPSVTNNGEYVRVTNWGLGELVIQVDQADPNAYLLVGQSITLNGQVTVESKATVDLFGFNYSQAGTDYQPAWGCYFASSIELNTRSFTTDGQLPVYDATKQELYAGDLGDLSLSFSATNYDETRGATVDGTKVIHHLGGIDDELGALDTALTTLDGEVVKSVNALTPTAGAVVLGGADIDTAHTAVNYTASAADIDAHLAGLDTEVGLAVNSVNTVTPTDGALTLGGANIDTAHTASDYTAAAADLDSHLAGIDTRLAEKVNAADGLDGLDDVDLTTSAPENGEILIYNATSSKWEPNPPPAPLATETSVGLVEYATDAETTAGTADNVVLRPSNIASIEISSLLNAGTAATADTGTAIGELVVLEDVDGSAGLPAVDGSQLTGISIAAPPVNTATGGTITVPTGSEAFWLMSPTADTAVTLSSPTAGEPGTGDDGKRVSIKNYSAFELTLNGSIDGAASFVLSAENSAITLVAYNGGWYIV